MEIIAMASNSSRIKTMGPNLLTWLSRCLPCKGAKNYKIIPGTMLFVVELCFCWKTTEANNCWNTGLVVHQTQPGVILIKVLQKRRSAKLAAEGVQSLLVSFSCTFVTFIVTLSNSMCRTKPRIAWRNRLHGGPIQITMCRYCKIKSLKQLYFVLPIHNVTLECPLFRVSESRGRERETTLPKFETNKNTCTPRAKISCASFLRKEKMKNATATKWRT